VVYYYALYCTVALRVKRDQKKEDKIHDEAVQLNITDNFHEKVCICKIANKLTKFNSYTVFKIIAPSY
jgi:hypothetical protein